MRIAEFDQARALGVDRHRALKGDAAKLVGLAFGWAHRGLVFPHQSKGVLGQSVIVFI
jgi:hypothetical protein